MTDGPRSPTSRSRTGPRITGTGVAVPPAMSQRELWDDVFAARTSRPAAARRVWDACGIVTRHGVVDPRRTDVSAWGTERRLRCFAEEAVRLGAAAVERALACAGVAAADVAQFTVASCTGYTTPGPDLQIARELGMAPTVERLFVGHMGCYAAVPGLRSVADTVALRGGPAVLLCVELPSLHVQPPDDDGEQLVAHALFADAAAAVVVTADGPGLAVVDVAAVTDRTHEDDMTWTVTDTGFRMRLSARVPHVLARAVRPFVDGLLARHGLTVADVDGWAVHPGGPRILDVCGEQLGLAAQQLAASRATLAAYGNCSSATLLLVLQRLAATAPCRPGRFVVALAFGPGLTLYGALLQSVP